MEKFKIEVELTGEQIKNIRALGCVGLCAANDGRVPEEVYKDMAFFIDKLNKSMGDDFGENCLLDEVSTNNLYEFIIKPYVRSIVPFMFKPINILDLLQEES